MAGFRVGLVSSAGRAARPDERPWLMAIGNKEGRSSDVTRFGAPRRTLIAASKLRAESIS